MTTSLERMSAGLDWLGTRSIHASKFSFSSEEQMCLMIRSMLGLVDLHFIKHACTAWLSVKTIRRLPSKKLENRAMPMATANPSQFEDDSLLVFGFDLVHQIGRHRLAEEAQAIPRLVKKHTSHSRMVAGVVRGIHVQVDPLEEVGVYEPRPCFG